MPRCVAAATSILSTPMPARPITLRLLACSSSAFVTLVAERTARPSNWPMMRFSSSGERPVITWASMPRSAKMEAARALSASAINTFGMVSLPACWNVVGARLVPARAGGTTGRPFESSREPGPYMSSLSRLRLPQLAIGPVEPGQQRLDVAALDGGAGPDSEARRRIAMAGDVVGDAFRLEQRGEFLDELRLRLARQGGEGGIGEGEADRGAGADARSRGEEADPRRPLDPGGDDGSIVLGAADERGKPADGSRPA